MAAAAQSRIAQYLRIEFLIAAIFISEKSRDYGDPQFGQVTDVSI
jgi:hypothetical protein